MNRAVLICAVTILTGIIFPGPLSAQQGGKAYRHSYSETQAPTLPDQARNGRARSVSTGQSKASNKSAAAWKLSDEAWYLYENPKSNADLKEAVRKYEKALSIFGKEKNLDGMAWVFNNLGLVYLYRGQNDKAEELFRKAVKAAREVGNLQVQAFSLINIGTVRWTRGQLDLSEKQYKEGLAAARKGGHRKPEAFALYNLADVLRDRGRYAEAEGYLNKALEIYKQIDNKRGVGDSLNLLGWIHHKWTRHKSAKEYYMKSLEMAASIQSPSLEGLVLNNIGLLFYDLGDYANAADTFEKSLSIGEKLRDPNLKGWGFNNLGLVYHTWGQYVNANDFYKKGLAWAIKRESLRDEALGYNNLGTLYQEWGQYGKAVDHFSKAGAMWQKIGEPQEEGRTLLNMGQIYSFRGENDKALNTFKQGLSKWDSIGISIAWPKDLIGNVYMDMGELQKAEPFVKESGFWESMGRLNLLKKNYTAAGKNYEDLLKVGKENRSASQLFTAYTGLGTAHEAMGEDLKAAEYYGKAVTFTEDLRSMLTKAQREKFFDVKVGGFYRTAPYEGLARVLMKLKRPLQSFRESEYTKARIFAESISRWTKGMSLDVPADVLKQDALLNDQLAALKRSRQKAYKERNKELIRSLEPAINEAEKKLTDHVNMLREKYKLFAATKYPEPMELKETALGTDEWVLAYEVTDSALLIYLSHGKNQVKGIYRPIRREELEKLIRDFRKPLEMSRDDRLEEKLASFDLVAARKLADILVADILDHLPEGSPVIVVPDDSLAVLPFEILILSDKARIVTDKGFPRVVDARFFGDRNPISYYQSVTALTLVRLFGKRKKTGQRLLIMSDPVFGPEDERMSNFRQPTTIRLMGAFSERLMDIKSETGLPIERLPLTAELGENLKDLYPGETDLYTGMYATKPTLFKLPLARYRSMVFATHGYLGTNLPGVREPALILTNTDKARDKDGFLRMSEVMGLQMNADMVALTACQTGLGRRISGEGTMGMGRAFQHAGAKAVLMSLWSVAEKPSVLLVESFFRHLKDGKSKLSALKLAGKEIREKGYDHPFFWAPFILVGEVN
ncbi:tetratricopeptide repeat protein [Thermodesulfobacteriota bacterium]